MANTRDIIAPAAEKAATPRSISAMLGTTITDAKGHCCIWFAVQNKDGAKSLYIQDDNDATAENDNIEIAPGIYRPYPSGSVKYDLREEFIRVSADDPVFSIEVMWG